VLISALFLQGCQALPAPEEDIPIPEDPSVEVVPPPVAPPILSPPSFGRFTLRYDSKSTLNPITSSSSDNILLTSLMYESLFTLDGNLNVEPVLCESWSTEDNITYIFELRPEIAMSDGSYLTADDVTYTLRRAMTSGRFVNRLNTIRSIASDGDLTVTIVLNSANRRFIRLLDVPIIKNGSINNRVPPGTGPYIYTGEEALRLERFPQHRDFFRLPLTTIYLRECGDSELTELFDDGELSLLWDNPTDPFDIRLNRLRDTRFYDTTAMQFIGFNARSVVLRNQDVRRAIGCAINRQHITEVIMPGQTLAAPLAISPAYEFYDVAWERVFHNPLVEMALLINRAGLEDYNQDSFFEYRDDYGVFQEFSLDFIVNSENIHKIRAAHSIADTLRRTGFDITVRELPWDRFISALRNGNFDMYYGETVLSADFDLSPLLLPNGRHNYGLTGSTMYQPLIDDFLSAQTDADERAAAARLCEEIRVYAPFVPILYKRYAIYTPLRAIIGATPSQSGIFHRFADWSIDLTMLS
jgi:peptide/nickel transport system substrate-binding protein